MLRRDLLRLVALGAGLELVEGLYRPVRKIFPVTRVPWQESHVAWSAPYGQWEYTAWSIYTSDGRLVAQGEFLPTLQAGSNLKEVLPALDASMYGKVRMEYRER